MIGKNIYKSTEENWTKYFYPFNLVARNFKWTSVVFFRTRW